MNAAVPAGSVCQVLTWENIMSNGRSRSLHSKSALRLFLTTSGSWLNKPLHSLAPSL
jgi:hypothetical protein